MKKLKLKLGKEMLSKEQMKSIKGGYEDGCGDICYETAYYYCCDTWSGAVGMGNLTCCQAWYYCGDFGGYKITTDSSRCEPGTCCS